MEQQTTEQAVLPPSEALSHHCKTLAVRFLRHWWQQENAVPEEVYEDWIETAEGQELLAQAQLVLAAYQISADLPAADARLTQIEEISAELTGTRERLEHAEQVNRDLQDKLDKVNEIAGRQEKELADKEEIIKKLNKKLKDGKGTQKDTNQQGTAEQTGSEGK